jgi:bis(5'-nucleosidyl)-tetraphosphatase
MKNTEVSSGAVIVKRTSSNWDLLCIRDMKGMFTFPKGFVEHGESIIQAARREAKEETGIVRLRYKATLPPVSYVYTRDGLSIHKTVYYALFTYTGNEKLSPQVEEGISELQWISISQAHDIIGYPKSNKPVIQAVMTLL